MSDRYYVVTVEGFTTGHTLPGYSYSVLDSAYCHREVFCRYSREGSGTSKRLRQCEAEAARLNALDRGQS
jgi:hypothetical protein